MQPPDDIDLSDLVGEVSDALLRAEAPSALPTVRVIGEHKENINARRRKTNVPGWARGDS
jgi:hypothetical protein